MTTPWLEDVHPSPHSDLPRHADVAVVGGGLVGVALARGLAAAGRLPLVLEREHLAAGASGRNAGLLLPGTAELYPGLVTRWGRSQAAELWRGGADGARRLVDWLAEDACDADWRPEGALHVATTLAQAEVLADAMVTMTADGFDVSWLAPGDLSGFTSQPVPSTFHGALYDPLGGPLHSGRLVTGLAAAAARRGARFVEGCAVKSLRVEHTGVMLDTTRGGVRSDLVVVATNAWANQLIPGVPILPVRGQVLATAPLPPGVLRGAWSLNDGSEYGQQLPDGRLLLGGMRQTVPDREVGRLDPEVNDAIQARLESWLAATFPALDRPPVPWRWAGIMAWTPDRLPLIGPACPGERVWLAAGFNGHGLSLVPLAVEIVAGGLTGHRAPPLTPFFALDRFGAGLPIASPADR